MASKPKKLSVKEVADQAGISTSTVNRAITIGDLPATKSENPGRGRTPWEISPADAKQFIKRFR
jgi:excisionase family DNA binding protein